jgi:hypothetical protein
MLKMLTGLTLWLILFALYPLSSRAQVHGSGGGPDRPGNIEAFCTEIRDRSRDLEKEYLESRDIPYEGDQSFFDEIHRLTAKTLYKAVSNTDLVKPSCGTVQLPPHTPEQLELLRRVERLWVQGVESPKTCLGRFKSRSRTLSSLKCVIHSLSHESK